MEKFVMKKSADANIYKSIRFPTEINDKINSIVNKANEAGVWHFWKFKIDVSI